MAGSYAHYRFGLAMLDELPGDLLRSVKRFRGLYDVGLHGPDIFAYYKPLLRSADLHRKYRNQSGKEFFTRVCRSLRLEPAEAGRAYLYGVLANYCLESTLGDFLRQQADKGVSRGEIEREFDRYLLVLDGKASTGKWDISAHMHLTAGESSAVAKFYPPATENTLRLCLHNMALVTKVRAVPDGHRRNALQAGITLLKQDDKGFLVADAPNPKCTQLNEPLLELYRQAEARFPVLLEQISAHLTYNAPFDSEFDPTF
jgi:hypothetical protein